MLALAAAGYGPLVLAGRKMLPPIPVVVSASSPITLPFPSPPLVPFSSCLAFPPLAARFPITATAPLSLIPRRAVGPAEATWR